MVKLFCFVFEIRKYRQKNQPNQSISKDVLLFRKEKNSSGGGACGIQFRRLLLNDIRESEVRDEIRLYLPGSGLGGDVPGVAALRHSLTIPRGNCFRIRLQDSTSDPDTSAPLMDTR